MRWWIAVLLVGCADPSPEEHYDSLKARVTGECGGRRIAPCNDTSPIEPAVACMQDALDQGMVALYAQSQLTTHGFLNTTSIIAADHEVWSFSDLSDEHGGFSVYESGPCTGPFSASSRFGCPSLSYSGCPPL